MFLLVGLTCIFSFYFTSAVFAVDGASPVGWASYNDLGYNGTTGGTGGPTVTVNNETNLRTYATSTTPGPYIVQVEGTITLTDRVDVSADKTIIGIGTNPTIVGELRVDGISGGSLVAYNVIIRNLIIKGSRKSITSDGDGVLIQEEAHHVWVDHCTFTDHEDGAIDISKQCDYITVSWNRFYNHDKTCLLGHSNSETDDIDHLKVTYHHNHFDGTIQRHPRVRYSFLCHVYNNFYDGNVDYGIASTCDAYVLAEGNYFKDVDDPILCFNYSGNPDGWMVERYNIYDNSGTPEVNPPTSMPEPSTYYSYILDDAADVSALVQAYAGAENPYPPHWLSYRYGDFDGSGLVDVNDLDTFAGYWLDTTDIDDADYFDNGRVDAREFALFAQNWFEP
jgi:pectate lyase